MVAKSAGAKPPFSSLNVAEVFAAVPRGPQERLLQVRRLLFETADKTPGVGRLEESLRWGEPSYFTAESKSGTPVRLHWKERQPKHCAMYVHCQTNLVERYRSLSLTGLEFEGSRAILFRTDQPLPKAALRACIVLALTYRKPELLGMG